jgi:WD40 repeat protein
MTALFVSHSVNDQAATERVRDRLRAEGIQALFVDFDPDQGIPAGRNWERELYAQIRKADGVVFLASPASVRSQWCFAEVALARLLDKPVFPMIIEAGPRHPLLRDTQEVNLVRDGDGAFGQLWAGLRRAGLDPHTSFAWDPNRSPYPGLTAFSEQDAAVFFGREHETHRLLDLLKPTLNGRGQLVAVVGPSGSGKSSLVRAGLLPRLARLPHQWLVLPRLVPGPQPIRQLARSVAQAHNEYAGHDTRRARAAELADQLADGAPVLVELIERLRDTRAEEPPSVLLVIDQAEELATLTGAAERAAFLDLVHGAVHSSIGVWILATIRAEFFSPLLEHPGAASLIDEVLPIGPLHQSQLFEVVEGPADRAGLQFAPGLAGRLVNDTVGGDALPLLAFTLRQLADHAGPDGHITIKDYEAVGGVVGALRSQADRTASACSEYGPPELVVMALTRLATISGEGELTRRRVLHRTLPESEREIVQAFIDARLLTSDTNEQGEAIVEVAHEALLRQWPPLRQAIDARREQIRLRADLERWAQDWERAGRQDSYLISGDRLLEAQRWAATHSRQHELLPHVWIFLQRSTDRARADLERQADALAERVLHNLPDLDSELNVALALVAIEEYAPTGRAILALTRALDTPHPRRLLDHQSGVRTAAFSPDGNRVVTASVDGTARVWDKQLAKVLVELHQERVINGAAFSPDGNLIVTASEDHTARVWEASTGVELLVLRGHQRPVGAAAFSPDGDLIATASEDHTARIWDATSGTMLRTLDGHRVGVNDVAFSPDGNRIVTADTDGNALVWVTATGTVLPVPRDYELHPVLNSHKGAVNSAAFSPDGTLVVTASDDRTVQVWDARNGERHRTFRGHRSEVTSATFSPDGIRLLSAANDGLALVWRPDQTMELFSLRHKRRINHATYSPDGSEILTTSADGVVRVWGTAGDRRLGTLIHQHEVKSVTFSPDGVRIMTADADGILRLWHAVTRVELATIRGHDGEINYAAFSSDGARIVTAGEDYTVRVWDAYTGSELLVLKGHERRVNCAVFSPKGDRIVTASADKLAHVWDATTGVKLHSWARHRGGVNCAAFSPSGTRIVTASNDHTVRVWDATMGTELLIIQGHALRSNWAEFSPDGDRIVTVGADGGVWVWDAETGAELAGLGGHHGEVNTAAFSPDGKRIVTAGADHTARVWDVSSGTELLVLRGHTREVNGVAFSPDGKRIVTAGGDRAAHIWEHLSLSDLVAVAKEHITRPLKDEERRRFGL